MFVFDVFFVIGSPFVMCWLQRPRWVGVAAGSRDTATLTPKLAGPWRRLVSRRRRPPHRGRHRGGGPRAGSIDITGRVRHLSMWLLLQLIAQTKLNTTSSGTKPLAKRKSEERETLGIVRTPSVANDRATSALGVPVPARGGARGGAAAPGGGSMQALFRAAVGGSMRGARRHANCCRLERPLRRTPCGGTLGRHLVCIWVRCVIRTRSHTRGDVPRADTHARHDRLSSTSGVGDKVCRNSEPDHILVASRTAPVPAARRTSAGGVDRVRKNTKHTHSNNNNNNNKKTGSAEATIHACVVLGSAWKASSVQSTVTQP